MSSLQKLANKNLVDDFDLSQTLTFCEACSQGKQHRNKFIPSSGADELLELVHSDVCGKMNEKSLGGVEYFLTLILLMIRHGMCGYIVYSVKTGSSETL